jgi:hypothetical protein
MDVKASGEDVFVSEKDLKGAKVSAIFEVMTGEAVS